jgi:hypothetical protein
MGRGKSATLRPISPIFLRSSELLVSNFVASFTSPENPARTVLAANVFPTCGVDAVFSNVINYSIVVRRARVAGLGALQLSI